MQTLAKFSQSDEQEHILACFGSEVGRFLDIGAWHPKTFSNTRALYEAGWSGVMIEPSPEPFLSLLREYGQDPRVDLVLAAVGFQRGLVELHATADATSTTDREHFEKWKGIVRYYGSFHCPVVTIPELLHQFGDFQFINIDTENTSVDIFHGILETELLPRCICVEYMGTTNRLEEVMSAGEKRGYRSVYRNGENVILTRRA